MKQRSATQSLVIFVICVFVTSCSAQPQANQSKEIKVGKGPAGIAIADINGDGKADVIVANADDGTVSILMGDGKGGLVPSEGSPFPTGPGPNDVAIADFNGDHKLDLAFPNHGVKLVTVLLGDGKGKFSPAPGSPFAVTSRPHPHGIVAGDWNRDGKIDLAIESWGENKVLLLMNDGTGRFTESPRSFATGKMPYQKLRSADVNRDGFPDIVTSNFEGSSVTLLLGDGKGSFNEAPGSPFPVASSPFGVALGDVNKDGNPDIVTAHYSGQGTDSSKDGVFMLLGDGKGGFRPFASTVLKAGKGSGSVVIADFDGDGSQDIATVNLMGNDISIIRSTKTGFQAWKTIAAGKESHAIAAGDLNGDGKTDIVVSNYAGNSISVWISR